MKDELLSFNVISIVYYDLVQQIFPLESEIKPLSNLTKLQNNVPLVCGYLIPCTIRNPDGLPLQSRRLQLIKALRG